MSVAFRRESDEEHLVPKFERPMPPGPNWVTPRGLQLIGEHIARLEAAVAAETDETALAAAKRDLRYWQARRASAESAPLPEPDTVGFGSRVTFRMGGRQRTLTIVGSDEVDADGAGRGDALIGFTAPLARALTGAEAGELIDYNGQANAIEVVAVEQAT